MDLIISKGYSSCEKEEILKVWRDSVVATHNFLTLEDINYYHKLIAESYLKAVDIYLAKNRISNEIVGFIGLSDNTIEMLFVAPLYFNCGIGGKLLDYVFNLSTQKTFLVDVNEQNPKAYLFYLKKGFKLISRSEKDSSGRDFPILHLMLERLVT